MRKPLNASSGYTGSLLGLSQLYVGPIVLPSSSITQGLNDGKLPVTASTHTSVVSQRQATVSKEEYRIPHSQRWRTRCACRLSPSIPIDSNTLIHHPGFGVQRLPILSSHKTSESLRGFPQY